MGPVPQRRPTGRLGAGASHRGAEDMTRTVAIGGLGAIGLKLARALDGGIDGLRLIAVAARDQTKARANLQGFRIPPRLVSLAELADADIVVEAAPAAVFDKIAGASDRGQPYLRAGVGRRAAAAHAPGAPRAGNRGTHRGADRRVAGPRCRACRRRGPRGERHHRKPQAAARIGGRALSGAARYRREPHRCAAACVRRQCVRCRRRTSPRM